MNKTPLLVTHDGSVDEFASIALLCGADFQARFDIKGVVVINGDTLGVPAYYCTKRILNMCGQGQVPVGLSAARAINGFPWAYRQFPLILNTLPALPEIQGLEGQCIPDGDELLANVMMEAGDGELVVLNLGGLTPFAQVAGKLNLWHKVKSMFWMGGVLDGVEGNIDGGIVPGAPGFSEWNVFFDPPAVQEVYDNCKPAEIYQFPLNVTNAYPNSAKWIRNSLNPSARAGHQVVDFLANAYAAVVPQGGASLWDVVTTIGLMNSGNAAGVTFYEYTQADVWVESAYGPNEGRLMPATSGGGRTINVATENEPADVVSAYALQQWETIPNHGT
ncbi:nucleoside hydrolase [uncultured Tateyamaria sp.]|uniref:nucleoside hydrolase n=1 Tax=uncultured Tateyamaria sp. TaxID=455651 RepID=UPI0026338488|nr:nucleoside hydrolase [uncultured Tateyamaria sp.]